MDNVLPALTLFATAASITPGPNNIMVMASGANFGFVRSLPHLCGISAGVFAIISLIGLGLMAIFETFPVLQSILKGLSTVYLLWLAWKIANAAPPETYVRDAVPLTFLQSAAFQGVNPKIWATGFSAVAIFAADRLPASVMLVASVFAGIGMASNAIWTGMGTALRHWLSGPKLRAFNVAMAVLLMASIYPVLFH